MLFEFENAYNLDTGDLLQIFYASGVHLNKDVSLSFSFVDPQGKLINSDITLKENPLIKNINYDIIDINGAVVYENYLQGLTRTFALTEINNIALFGEYKKDFGVRCSVSNFINDNKFIAEYYLYGNVPQISGVLINDGSGIRRYSQNLPYENINTGIIKDKIELNIEFSNNPTYILYDYIDIFSLEKDQNNNFLPIANGNFIYRYPILNNIQLFKIDITSDFLPSGNYSLAVVPYSKIGSGEAFYIEPVIVAETEKKIQEEPALIIKNEGLIENDFIEGSFIGDGDEIIDTIDLSKNKYHLFKYTTLIIDANKMCSSELKVIYNSLNLELKPLLTEYAISENNFINYKIESTESNLYLIANGASKGAQYRLSKTSIG